MIIWNEIMSRMFRRCWDYFMQMVFFKRSVHNRSIVRAIGTILPLPPPPRIYFNLATWSPEFNRITNERGYEVVFPRQDPSSTSDVYNCSRTNCHQQIEDLQKELNAIKDKLACLLAKEHVIHPEKILALDPPLKNSNNKDLQAPPPPPPPPPPMPEHPFNLSKPPIFRKSRKHIARSPGGRPIKPKREPQIDPSDILSIVLKKRYSVIQDSSDTESLNASFTDSLSPMKAGLKC